MLLNENVKMELKIETHGQMSKHKKYIKMMRETIKL